MIFIFNLKMEKITQSKLLQYCENIGLKINVKGNKEIFVNKIPDGWFIDNEQNLLLIFECKERKDQWKQAKQQLQSYCTLAENYAQKNNLDIIPVFVYGTESISLYYITDFNSPFETEFKELYPQKIIQKYNFNPHKFNQYIYDNFPTISSDERLKIIIAVLLTKSQKVQLSSKIWQSVLFVEDSYGMKTYFEFLAKEPYSHCVEVAFKYFESISSDHILQALYDSFVEISHWSFKSQISGKSTRKNLTQTEGAVLTPPDIVSLMVKELSLKSSDVVCDPCCGTGNFLLEARKYTNFLLGNELDLTRSIIAKHGLIISNSKPNIENLDCLLSSYKPEFDYLLLNPPYDHKKEQRICLKFIELSKKGGAIIIPSSNFRDTKFMEEVEKLCSPTKLIQLNNKIFYPVAAVETSILIYTKTSSEKLCYYDFTDDGFEIKTQHGRAFKENKEPILKQENKYDEIIKELSKNLLYKLVIQCCNDYETIVLNQLKEGKITFGNELPKQNYIIQNFDSTKIKFVKFDEIFEFISPEKIKVNDNIIPLYGATQNNIPQKYVNYYLNSLGDELLFSINTTGDGACGFVHIMPNTKFAVSSRYLFKQKSADDKINPEISSILISTYLHNYLKYSRSKGVSKDKFVNEIIPIYFKV